MAKWKELGEVPDSEDESLLDSEESQPELAPDAAPHPAPDPAPDIGAHELPSGGLTATNADVWDVPLSSQNSGRDVPAVPRPSPGSSPLSSVPYLDGYDRAFRGDDEQSEPGTSTGCNGVAEGVGSDKQPDSQVSSAPDDVPSPRGSVQALKASSAAQMDVSGGLAHSQDSTPVREAERGPVSTHALEENDGAPRSQQTTPERVLGSDQESSHLLEEDETTLDHVESGAPGSGSLGGETEAMVPQEATRAGRSFRPRKPIQEHPYRLSEALYAKEMKGHGLKPYMLIHMPDAERRQRQRHDKDSQEEEYEEDSQQTIGNGVPEDTEESQISQNQDMFDDVDELALTPARRPSPDGMTSSQNIPKSSQSQDAEDLPSLDDIFQRQNKPHSRTSAKRRGSTKASGRRKAMKLQKPVRFGGQPYPHSNAQDFSAIPPSPPHTSPALVATIPAVSNKLPPTAATSLTPRPSSRMQSRDQTPASVNNHQHLIDLTNIDDLDGIDENAGSYDQDSTSLGDSEEEAEDLRKVGRRIRGVLPASWLRLDESGREKGSKTVQHRSPTRSPERSHRKGVAQRRRVPPKPSDRDPFFFEDDDDSDDDDGAPLSRLIEKAANDNGHTRQPSSMSVLEDDAASVIEEDHIDRMLPGRRRGNSHWDVDSRPRKKLKTQQTFKGRPGERRRQPKITGLLDRVKNGAASRGSHGGNSGTMEHAKRHPRGSTQRVFRHATPPRLSIVDMIEPDAPPFIRVAARTAKQRRDQGKSSPRSKQISLAARQDNVDALRVLRSWNNGKIQPRVASAVPPRPRKTHMPMPIQPNSSHPIELSPGPQVLPQTPASSAARSSRSGQPRAEIHQTTLKDFVTVESDGDVHGFPEPLASPDCLLPRMHSHIPQPKPSRAAVRPAQLEEPINQAVRRYSFASQKRFIDALYRKSPKALPVPVNPRVERILSRPESRSNAIQHQAEPTRDSIKVIHDIEKARPRLRKRFQPRQIDTTAPRYAHANDPLPREVSPVRETVPVPASDSKLVGLGPFGTHYTRHFDIFPLDPGVYFHQSTLIGGGHLTKALDDRSFDCLGSPRGHCVFVLEGTSLRWGPWGDQTSSEFGELFDWILNQLQLGDAVSDAGSITAVQGVQFVLKYLQEHLSLPGLESGTHFVQRILEVLPGFLDCLASRPTDSGTPSRLVIEIITRCLVISLQTLRICEKLQRPEAFQLEDLLKRISQQAVRELVAVGMTSVRALYEDLQDSSCRDRGIRNDQFSAICWVVLIQVLQAARLPRGDFWDVVSSTWIGDVSTTVDANVLEKLWHDLFTLLPLGEFNAAGLAIPGTRNETPLEGWTLPQKLVARVFGLYKSNPRQSATFNGYCRGIVSRCHYLVERWGWRKCNGIVGTIFDFFASQNLSHLRNEEAYKSPQFLEDLADRPSLEISLEDRCFHIFLKLLALAIKRLRKFGQVKDIRNLVTRVLPNHNRQYLKEDRIHEHELAALRNHHDLLCTLFWSAPADLRPSLHHIEKLVIPRSSHKEACLVNLRAWNQLARFVISSGGDKAAYKPFLEWQTNVFKQLLDQYSSVESSVQQQFLNLTKDGSREVDPEMIKRVVNMNKQTATDVLHFSLKANLDVMRHAPSLAAASVVMNTYQIHQVCTRFSSSKFEFDWGTIRAAVDIVNEHVTRIGIFFARVVDVDAADSWHGDDALMLLDRDISKSFFPMARNLLTGAEQSKSLAAHNAEEMGLGHAFAVASRLAARLLHAHGVSRLVNYFSPEKCGLFATLPDKMSLLSRRYLCLFIATLVDQGITDFRAIKFTQLELFLCAIVKPSQALSYENQLAASMKRHGLGYLEDAVVEVGSRPDYTSNRNLFDHTFSKMRKVLRKANSNQRNELQAEFSKSIRAVMEQIKHDLKLMPRGTAQQTNYIHFVRSIILIIRTNDIHPVDTFFYNISQDYSPSSEDPQLRAATLLSWGLKLEDGATNAPLGLSHFLYSNFKVALANGKLPEECSILLRGMKSASIFFFMLNRMFPAIIKTAMEVPDAWILMNVYVQAVENFLTEACVHKEIGEDSMPDLLALMNSASAGLLELARASTAAQLQLEYLHTVVQTTRLLNLLGPSIRAYLCMEPQSEMGQALQKAMEYFTDFTRAAEEHLGDVLGGISRDGVSSLGLDPEALFEGVQYHHSEQAMAERNDSVNHFVDYMTKDIGHTWVSDNSTLSVAEPRPARKNDAPSTQTGKGTAVPPWDARKVATALYEQVMAWNGAHDWGRPGPGAWRGRNGSRAAGPGGFADLLF